jgi:LacI family transcriptional regulator, galactose operon repressor
LVSIKDVASLAGVSDRTVSRVASGDTRLIRPETRARVLQAIEQLGYVPNRAAQFIRTNRSMVVGLMTDVVATTPYATEIVRGVQDALEATAYQLLTVNTSAEPVKEARCWQIFREHGIDGVLYVTMFHRRLPEDTSFPKTPVVLVNCSAPGRPELPSIVPDDYRGAYDQVSHLIVAGHRKIAYVTLNPTILAAELRGKAFSDALAANGIALREDWVIPGVEGYAFNDRFVAFEKVKQILAVSDRPTAIACGNDEIALQIYCAALELGLRVPADLSVIGFDDFRAVSNVIEPKLTTMALPYYEMGALAVKTLVGLLRGLPPPEQVLFPCRLISRMSIAPR